MKFLLHIFTNNPKLKIMSLQGNDVTMNKLLKRNDVLDPAVILSLILKRWYLFIIAIIVSFLVARFYINHTMTVYRTSCTILINETEDRPIVDNSALLQGLGLPGGFRNLQNQIMILKSGALIEKTLNNLPFEIEFYIKTLRNKLPIYPDEPVRILYENRIPLPRNIEFAITFQGDNSFVLESNNESYPLIKRGSFGEKLEIAGDTIRIEPWDDDWINSNRDKVLYFTVNSPGSMVNYYKSRIGVDQINRDGSVLRVYIEGTNKAKDVDFLNKHIESFQDISLSRKNTEADRRIQFIDNQLLGISDSLLITENRLQQFRSSNRVMDLSAQGQAIIGQVTLLENEKARLELEANYYDYLSDYLSKSTTKEVPLVPITQGITDPGLTRLVQELADLQGQISTKGAGELNPLQRNLEQRFRNAKSALEETLNGLRRANSMARSENQQQINRVNAQASNLPVTERQLLGIERKFNLNNELYTFLLETRAEQLMRKASNRADSEIVDPADERFSTLVAPLTMKIYLMCVFAGVGLTFVIIYLMFILNRKLKEEDLRSISALPIIGNIPRNQERSNTVVFHYPESSISETFRQLRSRLQFFTKEAEAPVVLVTSSMPGEGKTFTAINLASAYSLLDKNTILLGFDLRKPKIYQDFNLENEKGLSTWLIGQDKLEDIIQKTEYKNLSVITSGPTPPNPSELTALAKTGELFKLLKEKYDYIVVDSSPIGIVSDTLFLASLSDVCLLVVRPDYTEHEMLETAYNELINGSGKGLGLVINDISSDSKHHHYGEKYGYTKNKKPDKMKSQSKSKRKLF